MCNAGHQNSTKSFNNMLKVERFCVMPGMKTERSYFNFMPIQHCVIQGMQIERNCFNFMPKGEN